MFNCVQFNGIGMGSIATTTASRSMEISLTIMFNEIFAPTPSNAKQENRIPHKQQCLHSDCIFTMLLGLVKLQDAFREIFEKLILSFAHIRVH